MNQQARKIEWLVWAGLVLIIGTLLLAFLLAHLKLRAALGKPLPVIGRVADFTLTNQLGRPFSLADLRGHVWIADLIFTRCAGPCLKMSRQMKELQQALPARSQAKLISLTTDPAYDSPQVLSTYAGHFGADSNRWMFLTGTREQIRAVAVDSLKLSSVEKKPEERDSPPDLFLHSTFFVIVDKHGQLRGVFETSGEGIDPQRVQTQLLAAVRRLQYER